MRLLRFAPLVSFFIYQSVFASVNFCAYFFLNESQIHKLEVKRLSTTALEKNRTILNPTWIKTDENFSENNWESVGVTQGTGFSGSPYFHRFTSVEVKLEDKSIETEPFEISAAKWQHKKGRASIGFYIRLKETQEIIAMIEQDSGWSWKITHKYLKSETEEVKYGHTLVGTFNLFFNTINRFENHRLTDGIKVPLFEGGLVKHGENTKTDLLIQYMKSNGFKKIIIDGDNDFRSFHLLMVEFHETFGLEIKSIDYGKTNFISLKEFMQLYDEKAKPLFIHEAQSTQEVATGADGKLENIERVDLRGVMR